MQREETEPRLDRIFPTIANWASQAAGHASTFILASAVVVIWALSGPIFKFSDTWQLVINTGTTIVTFLMVFLIQNSQNRDSAAIQVKLDELIRTGAARNSLVGIEHLTERELEDLRTLCEERAGVLAAERKITREGGAFHRPRRRQRATKRAPSEDRKNEKS